MRNFIAILTFMTASVINTIAETPNILWITAEDMSPTLGCYGDDYASTPNIDQLAADGVVYTNAFATSRFVRLLGRVSSMDCLRHHRVLNKCGQRFQYLNT